MSNMPALKDRVLGVSLKMYFSYQKTQGYLQTLSDMQDEIAQLKTLDLFVVPDFMSLPRCQSLLSSREIISYGAQDAYFEDSGAFTGEVSPAVLAELGCRFVEMGHAERRRLFGETDELVVKKAQAAARNHLTPLICIGEVHQASIDQAVEECKAQIMPVLQALPQDCPIVFAYEPVWAIGQAHPASAEYVVQVIEKCRALIQGDRQIKWLYGGSANLGTFEKLASQLDGLFLGRFGHDVNTLKQIAKEVAQA